MWLGDTAALSEQARQAAQKCVLVFPGPKKQKCPCVRAKTGGGQRQPIG